MFKDVSVLLAMTIFVLGAYKTKGALTTSANYTFGTGTSGSYASTDTDIHTTASSITLGSGLSRSGIYTGSGNPADSFRFRSSDIGTGLNTADYIQFSVTANSGYSINLVGGTLTLQFASATSGRTVDYAVRSSVDGFASNLATGATSSTTFGSGGISAFSGSAYDNLSTVSFRIYAWDASTAANVYFDNIILNDTVVPEPINYALGGFGVAFVGHRVGRRIFKTETLQS